MRRLRIFAPPLAAAAVALTLLTSPLHSQTTIEDALRQLNSANGRGYLQPLADLFGANMSSGWYHSAAISKTFSIGVEFIGAFSAVEDKHKTYVAEAPTGFSPSTFETATIFGDTGTTVNGPGGTSYRGSDGLLEAEYMPSVVPQLRLGIASTEIIVRYFSSSLVQLIDEEDFPELNLLGVGGRHSISSHFENFPVDLSIGVFYSSLDLGNDEGGVTADYTGLAVGLQASKTFSVLTIFAGVASDGGKMTLGYTSTDPDEPDPEVSVDLDVKRKMKFTAGGALKLGPLKLFGDASFGPATTYSAGLRIGS